MRLLYSLIYSLALVVVAHFEYMKRPIGIRKRWLSEKLGRVGLGGGDVPGGPETLWLHAVSVGEVLAAETFLKALLDRHPGLRVVVSTITDTGQRLAEERLSGTAKVIYMPFDLRVFIKRAIAAIKPTVFASMETEFWPNLLWCMKDAGVPVIVINGRISDDSYRGYRRIRFFVRGVIGAVSEFCMQDEEYRRRIVELGAPPERVTVTGSLKFDITLSSEPPSWAGLLNGPVLVVGSTHRGEDEIAVDAYCRLRQEFAGLNMVLAPRHPERFDEVEGLLRDRGVEYFRRSRLPSGGMSGTVVLLDTIGELSGVYGAADVAVVGGSFVPHGGQNPLEPAYWGKAVVCGPNMWNFPFVEDFIRQGAVARAGEGELFGVLRELLSSPEKRQEMGMRAKHILDANRGATEKAVRAFEGYLK